MPNNQSAVAQCLFGRGPISRVRVPPAWSCLAGIHQRFRDLPLKVADWTYLLRREVFFATGEIFRLDGVEALVDQLGSFLQQRVPASAQRFEGHPVRGPT